MSLSRRLDLALVSAILVCLAFACSSKEQPQSRGLQASQQESTAVEQRKDPDVSRPAESATPGKDWEETFKFVRDSIRTEPSRFPLKTTEGVRWGRSGNSLEKALLLAQLLEDNGTKAQIAEGELNGAAAAELLGSMFPAGETFSYKKDVPISAPVEEPGLLEAVKRHFWVQVESGGDWVDLDPSFPGAEPGQAFAPVNETFEPSDEALKTRVSIVLESTEGDSGEPQPVLSWEGSLEEVANQPVSLSVVAEFQKADAEQEKEDEEEGGAVGGVFGGLGGGKKAKPKKSAAGEKVIYNAVLTVRGEGVADGQFGLEKKPVSRLALQMKCETQDEVVSEAERILFEKTERSGELPLFQRHAILITGNRIPAEAWQSQLKEVSDESLLADVKSRVEEIKKSLKSKKFNRETLEKSAALEEKLGPEVGHLLNMIFASTSDDQCEKEAAALAVSTYYLVPRILISSFAGDQEKSEASLDLRQDRIEAVPVPGQALNMRQTFYYGRGVIESILEGKLLELLTSHRALTTAALMQEAAQKNIPIRTYSSLEKDSLKKINPPDEVAKKLSVALDSGRIVVIPEKGIEWEGQKRWGWWDIDPQTMETVGVMDTGLHQAVLQRTILESEGPLESKMGFVIGAMTGAIDTYWMLSAMVLKYGELSKAALEEAKAYMKDINGVMCPGFEKKISVGVGVTAVEMEDCFKLGYEIKAEAGIEIKQGWCENFAKGFACASTTILNYYLSQAGE
jgi:hypothetical protein